MTRLSLFLSFFFAQLLYGQIVEETGSAQLPWNRSGFFREAKPKAEEIDKAIKSAKLNALIRYISGLDQNSRLNYQKIQSSIEADIDRIIPSVSLTRKEYDKEKKMIFISLRASIDSSLLRDRLVTSGSAAQLPSKEKSYVCGAFVSRTQDKRKAFDRTRTVGSRDESSVEEFEEVASNGSSTSFSADQRRDRTSTTAGSTTFKADEISWKIFPSENLDASISGVLKTAGYRLVPAALLGRKSDGLINQDAINEDYSRGDDLSQTVLDDVVEGCENLKLPYLSTGTLNVQTPTIHPIDGRTKVTVSVNIKVYDLSGFIPETIASIGPVQESALGDSMTTAQTSAIQLAGRKAGELIVAALQRANAR